MDMDDATTAEVARIGPTNQLSLERDALLRMLASAPRRSDEDPTAIRQRISLNDERGGLLADMMGLAPGFKAGTLSPKQWIQYYTTHKLFTETFVLIDDLWEAVTQEFGTSNEAKLRRIFDSVLENFRRLDCINVEYIGTRNRFGTDPAPTVYKGDKEAD